jgi:hypothetical protein
VPQHLAERTLAEVVAADEIGVGHCCPPSPQTPMRVTLSSRCRARAGASPVESALDAVDLVEKSEAEGRKLRRASNLSRSLIDGGRVQRSCSAVPITIDGLLALG